MNSKSIVSLAVLAMSAVFAGCAAEPTDEGAMGEDSLVAQSTEVGNGNVAVQLHESATCSASDWSAARAHAAENHSTYGPAGIVVPPEVTSCTVRNGYIVYTYEQFSIWD